MTGNRKVVVSHPVDGDRRGNSDALQTRRGIKRAAASRAPEKMQLGVMTGTENMMKCAAVTAKDRVVIITDKETLDIGEGIKSAAEGCGATVAYIMMEDLGPRPLTSLPPEVAERVRALNPTVSFFAATMKPGELGFRKPLFGLLVGEFNTRHVHMPGITNAVAGGEAMCADYDEVYRVTHAVLETVKDAKQITVTAPNGTNLTATFDHEHKELNWFACDGRIQTQGMMSNLPDGEAFTTPLNVNGTFVTNLLGDIFDKKYGVLKTPVTIEIKDGFAVSVSCSDKKLEAEVREYLFRGENTNRVGEFAIGTNTAVTFLIGNILGDEKAKGLHLAFGDPLGEETGAKWKVSPVQHCDAVLQGCTIVVDGRTIMQDGNFTLPEQTGGYRVQEKHF